MIRFRRVRTSRDGRTVTATILGPGADDSFDVYFTSDTVRLEATPEALVALAVPVGMRHGVEIRAPGRLDPTFLRNIDEWQRIFAAWLPETMSPTRIRSRTRTRKDSAPAGTAAFFTAGADSFYTALKHRDRLDALVYVWGFDVPLAAGDLRSDVATGIRTAATEMDVPLVEIESNLREWSDRHGSVWGMVYSAVALGVVAHLLPMGEVLMGSMYSYRDLFAWGGTPLTDPLLGGRRTRLIHDGCETDRVERLASIAASPVAMEHLRVCWENRGSRYNCGECSKCVRTMVALRICGALDRCATLPDLDLEQVRQLPHPVTAVLPRLTELIEHLRRSDDDPELLAACETALGRQDPAEVRWDLDYGEIMPLLFGPPPAS